MKKYETPVINVTEFSQEDVVMLASSLYDGKGDIQNSSDFASITIDF